MDVFSMTFNGKNSYSDFGLKIKNRPPRPKPERNVDKIEIPDKDGYLTVDHGTYKGFTLPVDCMLLNATDISEQARQIKAWLDGSGDLTFSDDTVKYKAIVINQFDIAEEINNYGEFEVVLDCQPLAESDDANTEVIYGNTLTRAGQVLNPLQAYNFIAGTVYQNNVAINDNGNGPVTLNNPGTRASKPIINLFGTGDITLFVGDQQIQLKGITDYVTIDSELMDCYKDTVLMNTSMTGDFPILQPGGNNISWSGTVNRIEIQQNSAWI